MWVELKKKTRQFYWNSEKRKYGFFLFVFVFLYSASFFPGLGNAITIRLRSTGNGKYDDDDITREYENH
jgi:hypothetical protein